MATPKRNWRGQFVKKLRDTPEGERCWLIWSRKWNCWHRRSTQGGACGYTDDLAQAGLFERRTADAYNDGWDSEAFHVSEKLDAIKGEIRALETKHRTLTAMAFAAYTAA